MFGKKSLSRGEVSRESPERASYPLSQSRTPNKLWVYGFAVCFVLISSLPYWVGYASQGEAYFSGFVFGVEDGNTYLAKMLRGSQGDWLFRSPFTASEQDGAFIFLPYLLLGKLSAPPGQHDQLVVLFHLFRMVGGVLAVLATYDFLAVYIQDERVRRLGVAWVSLGGGLGWLLVLAGQKNWLGSLPIDFYSPETFGFLGVYGIAHLPWARAFLLWGLRGYLVRGEQFKSPETPICRLGKLHPGILWLVTGILQPITGMVIGAVAGAHFAGLIIWQGVRWLRRYEPDWLLLRGALASGIGAGVAALPLVLYNLAAFTTDPYLTIWVEQSSIPAPHPLHYLAAYGLILPFAALGIPAVCKKAAPAGILLVSWFACAPVLISINFSLQRRLIEGLWVILVTLALVAFESNTKGWFRRLYWLGTFSLPSTLLLLLGGLGAANTVQTPVFTSPDAVAAYRFLARESNGEAVVLSSYNSGNVLPAWAPVFVVIGHRPESAGFSMLEPRVRAFYQAETADEVRISLLEEFGVDYVLWGPDERDYGNWDPNSVRYLALVFEADRYAVFRVVKIGN
jgi:hypothetical protein